MRWMEAGTRGSGLGKSGCVRAHAKPERANALVDARAPSPCASSRFPRVPVRESRAPTAQRGFTLLEIIVAFAVLGLALTLLLGTLSGGTRQVRWSADSGRAALHAQSLLDATGVGEVLKPGRSVGEFEDGRYRWVMDVAPYVDRSRPPPRMVDAFAPRLMQLQLTVAWGEGGPRERLQLQSLRLVQPDMSGGAP